MKPKEPLPPVYHNMRARLEEHYRFMAEARIRHATQVICPDCYLPPACCWCEGNPKRKAP